MESTVIVPEGFDEGSFLGPNGAGITIGWTGRHPSGLQSDPCQRMAHRRPDVLVGPTVDDFVDEAVAVPSIEISDPVDVTLGGYRGRYFELTVPSDIADCAYWRAFEPGLQAQGPDNLWSLWVMDVEGFRFTILTEEFPGTPAKIAAQLRSMVESVRFLP
jgi:hypothetical protein